MIVEAHRHQLISLCGSIICRKNKPNKLKKPLQAFYFFKLNLRITVKSAHTIVKGYKIADKHLHCFSILPSGGEGSLFGCASTETTMKTDASYRAPAFLLKHY